MAAIAGCFLFLFGFLLTLAGDAEPALQDVTTPGFIGCMVLGLVCLLYGLGSR